MTAAGSPTAGLLALGDSITVGDDGIPSWARILDPAAVVVARDGMRAAWAADELLPLPGGPFGVAVLYLGVNDVRDPGWDAERFDSAYGLCAEAVAAAAPQALVLTVPLDLGRPRAGAKVDGCNALIRTHAARVGAGVVELEDLAGPELLQSDAVHPTLAGQREIARRVQAAIHPR